MQETDQQTGSGSKTQLVEQISACLRTCDYSRTQDLLRTAAAAFPNDPDFAELQKQSLDGVKRNSEVTRLITESQELFAQQKSAEAIQLLRRAYDLDKNNSLARAILANALVEHGHSLIESDWWEAGKLSKQALELNPAHPTAKTIRNLIQERKEKSSLEEWIRQVQKQQSGGDLIAALSLIAEGLDVHDRDPKLLLLQDAIQRDQDVRKRQSRREDLEDLRRMESEIEKAKDEAAKQALAERVQALAAKYWTDGAVLTVANHLLRRLGFVPQESASASQKKGKGAPVIFHVPRPNAPAARAESKAAANPVPAKSVAPASPVPASPVATEKAPPSVAVAPPSIVPPAAPAPAMPNPLVQAAALASAAAAGNASAGAAKTSKVSSSNVAPSKFPLRAVPPRVVPRSKVRTSPKEAQTSSLLAESLRVAEVEASAEVTTSSARQKPTTRSNTTVLVLISSTAAVVIMGMAIFFSRKQPSSQVAKSSEPASTVSAPAVTAPAASTPSPAVSALPTPTSTISAPVPTQVGTEPSAAALPVASETGVGKVVHDNPGPADSGHNVGTLVVVTGQDGAKVLVNGKLQGQLTQGGQLRLPNLELKDYAIQVSKSGFQDPPQQKIRIRKGEEAKLTFNLQPQLRLASLTIQGGAPGTMVLVDQNPVGTIQADGTLSVATVNPGDHVVELRKDRFKPRQFKKQFVVGGTVTLAGADAALEAVPGELKITFSPADARVAVVKGDLLKMVSSGVPLSLAGGTYTLTARTSDGLTRSGTVEVVGGQLKTVDLPLAPGGMSKWDNPGAWKSERDAFVRKGGDFVLYGADPASGTFVFSAMLTKGHQLQWVLNYTDSRNYVLVQMDESTFYRSVIRNGQKTDEVKVPAKNDKKSFHTLRIRVSPTEIVQQMKQGDTWTMLDRWTQPGANLGLGKFGFYLPGDDQMAVSGFAHYGDLNIR